MTESSHIDAESALFLVALDAGDPDKQAAFDHAQGCQACARLLDEGRAMLQALDEELSPEPVSAAFTARVRRAVIDSRPAAKPWWVYLAWLAGALLSATMVALDAQTALPLEPAVGLRCVRFELTFALAALGAGYVTTRMTKGQLDPLRASAFAMAGALLGQVLLRTRCEVPHAALHLLMFHMLGVLLATGLGALAGRWISRPS